MARIDQHIMDDADLAGPFLFCAMFGTFLLLVSPVSKGTISYAHTNISMTVRKALVRLRLRPRSLGGLQPPFRLQHDVPTPLIRRSRRNTKPQQRKPISRLLALLLNLDTREVKFCPRILPPPTRLRELTRCRPTSGHLYRILPSQSRDCVVHVFQLSNVLCCW